MPTSSQSTFTLQNLYDDLYAKGDIDPGWDRSGDTVRPLINIANKTMTDLCGGEGMFPWKCNQILLPLFVWNSWQQDYASKQSPNNIGWLQDGVAVDIFNTAQPKPIFGLEVVRDADA